MNHLYIQCIDESIKTIYKNIFHIVKEFIKNENLILKEMN